MSQFDELQKKFPEVVAISGCWAHPVVNLSSSIDESRKEKIRRALRARRPDWDVKNTEFIVKGR